MTSIKNDNNIKEFLEFSKKQYSDDDKLLQMIAEFENDDNDNIENLKKIFNQTYKNSGLDIRLK